MKKFLKRIAFLFLFVFIFFNIVCAFQAWHLTHFYDRETFEAPHQAGFFEQTGNILFGEKFPKSLVVDSLHIPHSNVSITSEDGLKLACWKISHSDTGKVPKGAVIMFHGHGSNKSGVIPEAESFYNLGWNVFMVDFRAHGESDGNKCSIGYNEAKDVKAAYDYIMAGGEKNIVLWGISMGAAAITKSVNDFPAMQPQKLILVMPFGTMLEAVGGRVGIKDLPTEPLGAMLTFWGGNVLGVWAFSNKPEEYAKKITCPVLLQWGKEDPRVSAKETNAVFNNIAATKKTLMEYDGVTHQSICKKAHEKWTQNVTVFLNQ